MTPMATLRVKREVTERLLARQEFKGIPDDEVIYRANVRLGLARLGAISGIRVTDRVMAIAVLVGMRDQTEFGM
jgi:hypothetical protein